MITDMTITKFNTGDIVTTKRLVISASNVGDEPLFTPISEIRIVSDESPGKKSTTYFVVKSGYVAENDILTISEVKAYALRKQADRIQGIAKWPDKF